MYCPRKKILGPEIFGAGNDQKCHGAGLVSGPELSKYFEAELVQSIQGQKCLATGSVQKFRAGSVPRPYMVRGRKCLGAWK